MCKTISTAKELGKAISNDESRIIITGSLGDIVIRIEAIGPVAWGIVIGAVGGSIAAIFVTAGTGGVAAPASVAMHLISIPTVVVASGGISTATVLATIAGAGTGIGTLHALRTYTAKREGNYVVLTKRW